MSAMVAQSNGEHHRISDLCAEWIQSYHSKHGLGSMTCNIYDTAWVAIVSKHVDDRKSYLFPACLDYILDSQLPSGGWSTTKSDARQHVGVSQIVSSLAALFALHTISQHPCQFEDSKIAKVRAAVDAGFRYLLNNLPKWDVTKSREVGFEYLVPALLELLEREGFEFSFAQRKYLYEVRGQKMSKLRYENLYSSKKSPVLHSAELFFADPNFSYDSIRHHKVQGSIMASPSATAAYLMRASTWDDEAEAYLRHVMEFGTGRGSGGMPSAFPTTYFELTWVVSTLISAGLSREAVESGPMNELYTILREAATQNDGLIGFASDIEPDLDDTAQASIIFSKMGERGLAKSMGKYFAGSGHFQTYRGERHASFSANCNALYAILLDDASYISHSTRQGLIEFLCKTWWETGTAPHDKWNFSPFYSYMLISRTFMALVEKWDKADMEEWNFDTKIKEKVILILFQCLIRTLKTQNSDGHWGSLGVREETAYAILTLVSLKNFSLSNPFAEEINRASQNGRDYMNRFEDGRAPEQIWIEKTTYGSYFVSEAYIAAAMNASPRNEPVGAGSDFDMGNDEKQISKYTQLLGMVPLFKDCPRWVIRASWTEGQIYLRMLKRQHDVVFTRQGMTEDKYFAMIPLLWTCVNNLEAAFLASKFIFGMMTISFLNFQADEFMEVAIGTGCIQELDRVRAGIHDLFVSLDNGLQRAEGKYAPTQDYGANGSLVSQSKDAHQTNGVTQVNGESEAAGEAVSKVLSTLDKFAEFVLAYPDITQISLASRRRLCKKIETFLLAHVAQVEASDSLRVSQQTNGDELQTTTPVCHEYQKSFQQWLRTVSADHTSCPYSFEFALCLWENAEHETFDSVVEQYVGDDLCQHLAIICRLYNDLGSIKRDREEWNLNSVNFPEFHAEAGANEAATPPNTDAGVKLKLQQMADYERKHLGLAMSELEAVISSEMMGMVKVFVNITDLFGQIYVVKDLASQRT